MAVPDGETMHAINKAVNAGDLVAVQRLEPGGKNGRVLFHVISKLIDQGDAARIHELNTMIRNAAWFPRFVAQCLARHYQGDHRGLRDLCGNNRKINDETRPAARLWAAYLKAGGEPSGPGPAAGPPPRILQFWDDPATLPEDLEALMAVWRRIGGDGYRLFDKTMAADYLRDTYGAREAGLMLGAPHPAVMADYFRLGYLAAEGGFWLDADSEARPRSHDWLAALAGRSVMPAQTNVPWISINTSFLAAPAGSALMEQGFAEAGRRMQYEPGLEVLRMAGPVMLRDVAARLFEDDHLDPGLILISRQFMRREIQRPFAARYKQDQGDMRHWTHWQKQTRKPV